MFGLGNLRYHGVLSQRQLLEVLCNDLAALAEISAKVITVRVAVYLKDTH